MKTYFLMLLVFFSTLSYGQRPRMEARNQMNQEQQMSPEQRAQLQMKRMTLSLNLTDKQQKEIYPLLLQNIEKRDKKMAEIRAKRDKGEKLTADERFELQNDRLDNQIAMRKDLEKILTPEQMKTFDSNQKEMRNTAGERKRERRGNNSNN
jgi:periplasmic protein CpxP/Spy